jgi:hypothetical protein
MKILFGSLCLLFYFFPYYTLAQVNEVKGSVADEKGEPVIGAVAFIEEIKSGAFTNELGVFSLSKVPAGKYSLRITSIGYDTIRESLDLTGMSGKIVKRSFVMKERITELEEVVITDDKVGKIDPVKLKIGESRISARQIRLMPSLGSPDLAQYLQVLPGVITSGDQGGQLFVRGGTPIMNMVLLDGMIVYAPFHSIGVFSVFDPEYIRTTDVYSAGFGAEYGGRVSSVMDIRTRNGNLTNFSVKAHTNPFTSGVLMEGPLSKKNKPGSGSSYLLSWRELRLDKTSPVLYKSLTDTFGLPYKFRDIYGKLTFTGQGNRLNLFGFSHGDDVNLAFPSDVTWNAFGGGMNFQYLPSNSKVIMSGNIGYSGYATALNSVNETFPRSSEIQGLNSNLNFAYIINNVDELSYGVQILSFSTNFMFTNAFGNRVVQEESNTELAMYLKYRKVFKRKEATDGTAKKPRAVLEPGLRGHFFNDKNYFSLEPRLRGKLNFNRFSLHAATGLYAQNLVSSGSDLDVVNFFQGIMTAPDNLANPTQSHSLQTAAHLVGGTEIELFENLETTIEGWYKNFSQITTINRFKIFPADPDFTVETGVAYGGDVSLKYDRKGMFLYANYGLAFITRDNGMQEYPASFDRRHTANTVASYSKGNVYDKQINRAKEDGQKGLPFKAKFESSKWEFGGRWSLGSGFPFTQTQGFFEKLNFDNNGSQTNIGQQNGNLGILYSANLNQGRLPYFHRLDVSIKRRWQLKNRFLVETNISVYNTYNRDNIFYIDRVRYTRVNQLPLIPSVGIQITY